MRLTLGIRTCVTTYFVALAGVRGSLNTEDGVCVALPILWGCVLLHTLAECLKLFPGDSLLHFRMLDAMVGFGVVSRKTGSSWTFSLSKQLLGEAVA